MVLKIDGESVPVGETKQIGDATLKSLGLGEGATISWLRVNDGKGKPYILRQGDRMRFMAEDGSWSDKSETLAHTNVVLERRTFVLEAD